MRTNQGSHRTDQELIATLRIDGEESAFCALYRRYTPRLFFFVLRIIGGAATPAAEPEAEDIVQETWIRACERLNQFRGESAFGTWLLGIGLNVARNHLRRRRRDRSQGVEELPEVPVTQSGAATALSFPISASAATIDTDSRIDLERAIAMLPEGYRTVLILHDLEGMKHHEIAEALSIAVGTCKSQLFSARRWIRSFLSPSREVSNE
jgi:RNA polymerase sigma-70 factor (ECF subfamily)